MNEGRTSLYTDDFSLPNTIHKKLLLCKFCELVVTQLTFIGLPVAKPSEVTNCKKSKLQIFWMTGKLHSSKLTMSNKVLELTMK